MEKLEENPKMNIIDIRCPTNMFTGSDDVSTTLYLKDVLNKSTIIKEAT